MIGRVVNTGQGFAEQLALKVAASCGIPTGGVCPVWCLTETGYRPELVSSYALTEANRRGHADRLARVMAMSDAVLWVGGKAPGGYAEMKSACGIRPVLRVDRDSDVATAVGWLAETGGPRGTTLMVCGSGGGRGCEDIEAWAATWLDRLFRGVNGIGGER